MTQLRILVVDDNAVIGALIAEMLESLGHLVCAVATTEQSAIATAQSQKPDLMIVDMRLGAGSGAAAMNSILRAGPMPHVFISGAGWEGVARGATTLRKPFGMADLIVAMDQALAPPSCEKPSRLIVGPVPAPRAAPPAGFSGSMSPGTTPRQ
jgi:CheY-like chemotaxis protein